MEPLFVAMGVVVFWLLLSVKVLNEYERAVIFRLGKLLPLPKGPGLIIVAWPVDRMVRVSLRTVVLDVPPQDVITRDNVTVKVNAVVYFRVVDPLKSVVQVENYLYATSQEAQTTLRSILGQAHLDGLLPEPPALGGKLVQVGLAEDGPRGGPRPLAGRAQVVLDLDDRLQGIHHPEVDDRVHLHGDVVPGDHVLGGDVQDHGAQAHAHHAVDGPGHDDQTRALGQGQQLAQTEDHGPLVLVED